MYNTTTLLVYETQTSVGIIFEKNDLDQFGCLREY